jgi:hypothetical protein
MSNLKQQLPTGVGSGEFLGKSSLMMMLTTNHALYR